MATIDLSGNLRNYKLVAGMGISRTIPIKTSAGDPADLTPYTVHASFLDEAGQPVAHTSGKSGSDVTFEIARNVIQAGEVRYQIEIRDAGADYEQVIQYGRIYARPDLVT